MPFNELLELLQERALLKGQFTLASGRESSTFIDCKRVTLTAKGSSLVGKVMGGAIHDMNLPQNFAIAGVPIGGYPIATAVSHASYLQGYNKGRGWDALYVRRESKPYGTGQWVEGCTDQTPRSVIVLEDVLTTGGSSLKTVGILLEAGFRVLGVVALVDREEGARERFKEEGIPLVGLYCKSRLELSV